MAVKIKRKVLPKKTLKDKEPLEHIKDYLEDNPDKVEDHKRTKGTQFISGSLLQSLGRRESPAPIREWTDEFQFYDAVQNYIETGSKPWTHARLAYELGVGSVQNFYSYMDKGGMFLKAIEEFNLLVEEDLVRGALTEQYHPKMTELYLRTYIRKYTESKVYEHMPKKIQMIVLNNHEELKSLEEESRTNMRKLLDVSEIAAQTVEVKDGINGSDISDK